MEGRLLFFLEMVMILTKFYLEQQEGGDNSNKTIHLETTHHYNKIIWIHSIVLLYLNNPYIGVLVMQDSHGFLIGLTL
jgi:hypothetical protein